MNADTNYSINPWMRPEVRLGDNVDPSVYLNPAETILGIVMQVPFPPPAQEIPRFGYPQGEPGIVDVLSAGVQTLMRERDRGIQGTLRPATGGE